ncbi:MAG: TIGR00282 family metallophosphoesterase [Ruminococcaceae bacterium]|nr:TIGR00282 family metallophosphoesterase [Oscillospiraceae bacterium]
MSIINILCVGDVVGENGKEFIKNNLWKIRSSHKADMVIVNGENCGKYNSTDPDGADVLLTCGADVVTGGNHTWKRNEMQNYLECHDDVLRPANYPAGCPGQGYTVKNINGYKILVISLMGRVFMEPLACPFETAQRILEHEKGRYDFSICDFHAEATSEKVAFGNFFDGKINIIFGTHTHVRTADLRILPGGTGYITDIGMTGPHDSVLGIKKEIIIRKFLTGMPQRFEVADTPCTLNAALFSIDTDKKCITDLKIISN